MIGQMSRSPVFRAFPIIAISGFVWLVVAHSLPSGILVEHLCIVFIPVFFTIATAGSIIEKTERSMMELLLSKPYSRRDIVLADYLSVLSIYTVMAVGLSVGLWLIFGLRVAEWGIGFPAMFVSLMMSFAFLYSFILLTGLLLRNAGLVIVFWVGYIYFGVGLLEAVAGWMSKNGSGVTKPAFYALYYFLPEILRVDRWVHTLGTNSVVDCMPVLSSGISAALVLTAAVVYLEKRDIA
jgi:hypothetical protein